jgi:hypothetical protein
MRVRRRRIVVVSRIAAAPLWVAALISGVVISCGSRTGLFIDDSFGPLEGGTFADVDAGGRRDGPEFDALPPIDVVQRPDVDRTGCADADETFIYVVSEENELFSFFPPSLTFTSIGRLACPTASSGATPFSMAVDRRGVAYVVFTDGNLFRVSTATAACIGTSYVPNQRGWQTFGMGFASDFGGPTERLFVAENNFSGASAGLGRIDVGTMRLDIVNSFSPEIPRAELTGTGDGRLFAFWPNRGVGATGSNVAEVEKATANVVARTTLPIATTNDAFAFAFWGGDFWIFTGSRGTSQVTRFRPTDGTTRLMTTRPSTIVGAGVSTCAPQE